MTSILTHLKSVAAANFRLAQPWRRRSQIYTRDRIIAKTLVDAPIEAIVESKIQRRLLDVRLRQDAVRADQIFNEDDARAAGFRVMFEDCNRQHLAYLAVIHAASHLNDARRSAWRPCDP